MRWIGRIAAWLGAEYVKDYRESRARIFDLAIKNSLHLNTIILTVSIASLTAVAALNDRVFENYSWLSVITVGLFILTILFSTINFFLASLALNDLQQKISKDIFFPFQASDAKYKLKFRKAQKMLGTVVMIGFCAGLITLLALLGFYVLGERQ